MKEKDRDPAETLDSLAENETPSSDLPRKPKATSRRNLLRTGAAALAAGGASKLFSPGSLFGELRSANGDGDEELDLKYDLDRFEDGDPPDVPKFTEGEDIKITASDFTEGLSGIIGSLKFLDPEVKDQLTHSLAKVGSYAASGDAESAQATLSDFRHQIIGNADHIDEAAGPFAFGEVTSFTQTILVMVDFLVSLKARIVGVIFVFPWGQIFKIIEVFKRYTVCLTIIQIQVFQLYLRFFLFILVVRFRFFPGLRISIDILLLFISICIRVKIVQIFRVCITVTRRYLLLVRC
ncbi:MAG: hypothetical protein K0U98_25100 [Deltaproteobacteria bacterium]|nr:hypothetical protein [Deltaproteobacteria bacterium]